MTSTFIRIKYNHLRMEKWRLIDTEKLNVAENMVLDGVLLEVKSKGKSKNTIRLLQFKPRAVLVGYSQSVELWGKKKFFHIILFFVRTCLLIASIS